MTNRYRFDNDLDEKGKEKHIHLLLINNIWKPLIGTTTALKVLMKVLTWWASGLACATLGWIKKADARKSTKAQIEQNAKDRLKAAEAMMRNIALMAAENAPERYLALLDKAYAAHATNLDKSADKGTDMHKELEDYAKLSISENGGTPMCYVGDFLPVRIFSAWALKNVKRFIAAEGHSYSEKLWVGCIFDVLYEDLQDRLVILDHKSSDKAYMNHFFQCAGNDIQISENGVLDKDGNLVYKLEKPVSYYAVFPFGMDKPEPQFHYDTEGAKQGFEAAVTLHKLINQ